MVGGVDARQTKRLPFGYCQKRLAAPGRFSSLIDSSQQRCGKPRVFDRDQTLRTGGYLLFQEINLSTIGANGLDFRVRNENGYCPVAKPPDRNVRSIKLQQRTPQISAILERSVRERRPISTPQLSTLLCVHLEPINLVIS